MKISKSDRQDVSYSENWKVFDYPFDSEEVGIAVQKINGRMPERGMSRNNECKEFFYILNGTGEIGVNDEIYPVSEGDIVVADKGSTHYMKGDKLEFLTVTKPNWNEQQYEVVDDIKEA